jgi:hypothetical protein
LSEEGRHDIPDDFFENDLPLTSSNSEIVKNINCTDYKGKVVSHAK